jgi:DNA primase
MNEAPGKALPQQISLLGYLSQQGWKPARGRGREEVAGLCPLHRETQPSFYVNRRKQVFYCHGCGRGGDLIRLVELLHGLSFRQALAHLAGSPPVEELLEETFRFYQAQLVNCPEARQYLAERGIHSPETIARLRIGYAPGACLRAHLQRLGYAPAQWQCYGVIDHRGRDHFWRCLTFPLEEAGNLYGRAIDAGRLRHRFLPRPKGGLYGWRQARECPSLIVVEGLLDLAVLWQAGIRNVVAGLGTHLNRRQLEQLGDSSAQTIYVCLDGDDAGAKAAQRLVQCLHAAGIDARRVELPGGHDPNSFFVAGATAADFQRYLNRAQRTPCL